MHKAAEIEQLAHFVEAAINSKSMNSLKDNIHHNMSFYEEKTNFDIYI